MATKGTRVQLTHTPDPDTKLEPGPTGSVHHDDDLGTLHVGWDDGSSLALIPDTDEWWEVPEPGLEPGSRKRKVSVTLDADLLSALQAVGPISPQVNEAIRTELDRRRKDPEPGAELGSRKRKVSLSLDADLLSALQAVGPISPQVNEAIRTELDRRPIPAPTTESHTVVVVAHFDVPGVFTQDQVQTVATHAVDWVTSRGTELCAWHGPRSTEEEPYISAARARATVHGCRWDGYSLAVPWGHGDRCRCGHHRTDHQAPMHCTEYLAGDPDGCARCGEREDLHDSPTTTEMDSLDEPGGGCLTEGCGCGQYTPRADPQADLDLDDTTGASGQTGGDAL